MDDVVARSRLGRTTVSHAFHKHSMPTAETLVALASALGLESEKLLKLRRSALLKDQPPDLSQGHTRRPATPAEEHSAEDADFETRYRRYLRERHGQLTVVGLDLRGPAKAWWPLDAAYLSLELAGRDGTDDLRDHLAQQRVERAEFALSGQRRTLIRGLAGSGKTTLLQWLACATATGEVPEPLQDLQSAVAFFLPLRTISRRGSLPAPKEYLAAVGCPLAGVEPTGWADRVLQEGRGLILVDGLDEISSGLREQTGKWLSELVAVYSNSRVVVTTRPTAVPDAWLEAVRFRELSVRPMSRTDVGVFINRWHAAAKATVTTDELRARMDLLEETLKEQVKANRDLAQLTTTPLLCALVCALHRDRRGQLPRDRVELYSAALSMLLARRDQEREIVAPDGVQLSEGQSIQLLQRLAYWLIRNGQTELTSSIAEKLIAEALPNMQAVKVQGSARTILAHLIGRTGLLRAPTEDTVDFVHRTFQDFLGAKAAVESHDLPLVAKNAHDEQWEDVVRMAVAHGRRDERVELLEAILTRADAEPKVRSRLTLLALACLQHATELRVDVRSEIERRADSLIPPRSSAEVTSLVRVGPVVLDLLPRPNDLNDDIEAEAVIRTAQEIGGDAALVYLKSFAGRRSLAVRNALSRQWTLFDPVEYAEEVLERVRGPFSLVYADDIRQVRALSKVDVGGIYLQGDTSPAELAETPQLTRLETYLAIAGNHTVDNLDWVYRYRKLQYLNLYRCPHISSLGGLRYTQLTGLSLSRMQKDLDISVLSDLRNLTDLSLNTVLSFRTLSELPIHDGLQSLRLDDGYVAGASLKGLERWQDLVKLTIPGRVAAAEFDHVAKLPLLRCLQLTSVDGQTCGLMAHLAASECVTTLMLRFTSDDCDIGWIPRVFPLAETIELRGPGGRLTIDLTPLKELGMLKKVIATDFTHVLGTDLLPSKELVIERRNL